MEEVKSKYEQYVERYARSVGITVEEAEKRAIVKSVKEYYEQEAGDECK